MNGDNGPDAASMALRQECPRIGLDDAADVYFFLPGPVPGLEFAQVLLAFELATRELPSVFLQSDPPLLDTPREILAALPGPDTSQGAANLYAALKTHCRSTHRRGHVVADALGGGLDAGLLALCLEDADQDALRFVNLRLRLGGAPGHGPLAAVCPTHANGLLRSPPVYGPEFRRFAALFRPEPGPDHGLRHPGPPKAFGHALAQAEEAGKGVVTLFAPPFHYPDLPDGKTRFLHPGQWLRQVSELSARHNDLLIVVHDGDEPPHVGDVVLTARADEISVTALAKASRCGLFWMTGPLEAFADAGTPCLVAGLTRLPDFPAGYVNDMTAWETLFVAPPKMDASLVKTTAAYVREVEKTAWLDLSAFVDFEDDAAAWNPAAVRRFIDHGGWRVAALVNGMLGQHVLDATYGSCEG